MLSETKRGLLGGISAHVEHSVEIYRARRNLKSQYSNPANNKKVEIHICDDGGSALAKVRVNADEIYLMLEQCEKKIESRIDDLVAQYIKLPN